MTRTPSCWLRPRQLGPVCHALCFRFSAPTGPATGRDPALHPSFRARPEMTTGTAEGDAGLGTLPATAQGHGQSGSEWDWGESRCWPRVPPDEALPQPRIGPAGAQPEPLPSPAPPGPRGKPPSPHGALLRRVAHLALKHPGGEIAVTAEQQRLPSSLGPRAEGQWPHLTAQGTEKRVCSGSRPDGSAQPGRTLPAWRGALPTLPCAVSLEKRGHMPKGTGHVHPGWRVTQDQGLPGGRPILACGHLPGAPVPLPIHGAQAAV